MQYVIFSSGWTAEHICRERKKKRKKAPQIKEKKQKAKEKQEKGGKLLSVSVEPGDQIRLD